MTWFPRVLLLGVALLVAAALLPAQDFRPPRIQPPDEPTRKAISKQTAELGKAIRALRKRGLPEPLLADLEVYLEAAARIVRHNEFFQRDSGKWTVEALQRGLERTEQAAQQKFTWLKETAGKTVVRGYRSRIDGSVQPFAITYPKDYGDSKRWRVDVVLHGRDSSLTEVKFLHTHGDKPVPADLPGVILHIYGRGNNAYRWAGEADVFEAVDAFLATEQLLRRDKFLDPARWVLRGFSMGGAGTWHIGLHRPSAFCVLGPGAGFTTTHGYVGKLPAQLPAWQEKCLRIYDAVDYAENVFNVPVVAYAGAEDKQLQAARNIEARLKPLKLPVKLEVLVAPGLEHKFPPEWQKKAEEAYAPFIEKGREEYPPRVRFVTYTLKYPSSDWVRILALNRHYERALVDAERIEDGFKVKTENVRVLRLTTPKGVLHDLTVLIDGDKVTARPWGPQLGAHAIYLQRKDGHWQSVLPERLITDRARLPQKGPGLQGPIDDAFTEAFVCVRGTGKPWHEATDRYAEANLRRFRDEWAKYFRGDVLVKDDTEITSEDLSNRHLILFGDPSSNSLIGQVLDALPLQWTKDTITLGGKKYPAASHVPVLIYPSPLNPTRYVVLNSGHTFHAADFEGTNALLYPRLGDYAVLRLAGPERDPLGVEVATAGLFDEYWQIPKEGR
jgi:dienelactone hydrolase